jgi:hypothetical protein
MKKNLLILLLLVSIIARAQLSPVTWSFTATKLADRSYEIHFKATIQGGWHVYAQKQPEDAIAVPTKFTLNPNPLYSLDGKLREDGKMEKIKDKNLGVSANQYSNSVDFVQKVKMKNSIARTNFTGIVEYQTCNDEKCLPPKKIIFSVPIR